MNKIPVMDTAGRVWNFATNELPTIFRLTWCPLSLVLLIQLISTYFIFRAVGVGQQGSLGAVIMPIVMMFFVMVATTVAVVALHRLILFGDDKPGHYVYLSFGKTEFLFVALPVAIYFVMFIVIVVTALISQWLTGLVGLAAVFVIFRVFLIFPIIVVEGRYDFEQAWDLGRGNVLRFVGLFLIVFLPILVVMVIIGVIVGALIPNTFDPRTFQPAFGPRIVFDLAFQFVASIVSTALGVGVLSYSYKAAKGLAPDATLRPGT